MNAKATLKTLLAASVMALGLSHGALAQDTIKIGVGSLGDRPGRLPRRSGGQDPQDDGREDQCRGRHQRREDRAELYDDGGDPNKARTFATRLVEDDEVVAIIGGTTTGATMAIIPVAEDAEIPFISLAGAIEIIDPVKEVRLQDAAHRQAWPARRSSRT